MSTNEEETIPLKISPLREKNNVYEFYEFNFKSDPMNHEEERFLVIIEHYKDKLQMLPKKIYLKEDQLAVFTDTINHVSFYNTNNQKILVKLPSDKSEVHEFTKKFGEKFIGEIFYDIQEVVAPLKIEPLRIHYEYNTALRVFNYAQKIVEVSHWGNIAIEERFQVENVGAKLEGEFGRVDYDENQISGGNFLNNF
jgi:oligosaccharyltransferase complex subunit alpha (ribophorin I)